MADDDAPPDSRRRRLDARRRRYRWAVAACAVMIVGGAGTVAAFTLTDDAGNSAEVDQPEERPRTARSFDDTDLPELTEFVPADPPRALSHEDPLRVWVAGDSLAGALGPALGELNGATGVVDTSVDYKISSGLATNVRNWPDYAPDALADENPEVVVFMIGANDVTIANSQDGDNDGVPDWEPDYRADVGEMMDLLKGEDRVVLWIGSPTMRNEQRDRGAVEVNRIMREEATNRAPDIVYVDAYRLFAGDGGGYTETLEGGDGDTIRVRIGDGVHFTPDGAQHLASAVFALLEVRYSILSQADPENALDYSIADGGGSGGGSGGSGRGGGGNRPTQTTVADDSDNTEETTPETAPAPPTTTATTTPATLPPTTTTTAPQSTTTAPSEPTSEAS